MSAALDDLPVEDAKRFVTELGEYLETRSPEILETIGTTGELSDETEAKLKAAIDAFKETFVPTSGGPGSEAALGRDHAAGRGQARRGLGPHVLGRRRSDDGPAGRVEDSLEERTEGSEEGAGPIGEAGAQEPT